MLDAVPCTSSATCYAITQPVALHNGTHRLVKNAGGVWVRSDGLKLMKQSAFNNHYLSVSNAQALLAIGKTVQNHYFSERVVLYKISTPQYNYWEGDGYCQGFLYGIRLNTTSGDNIICTDTSYHIYSSHIHYEKGRHRQYSAHEIIKYTIVQ